MRRVRHRGVGRFPSSGALARATFSPWEKVSWRIASPPVLTLALAAALIASHALAEGQSAPMASGVVAVLQGLDKITGRVRTIQAPIEETVRFGTLDIMARTCRKRPPEEAPESAAFLEVREIKPGEVPRTLFVGWMFASSPAVSALEHPVYDVWVIDCRTSSPSGSSSR
ncbi:MAG: DUF2155 domain-containing protein [Pseudomonadota bacterium]